MPVVDVCAVLVDGDVSLPLRAEHDAAAVDNGQAVTPSPSPPYASTLSEILELDHEAEQTWF